MSKKQKEIPLTMSLRPGLDERGREVPSSVSLVTVAHQRPPSLGERIRRYSGTPHLQDDLYYDEIDDDDYVDYDGPPMSKFETRYSEIITDVKKKKAEKAEKEKAQAIEKEKADNEAFQARVREAMSAGSIPPQK